jgi:hypothetical protein
MWADWAARIQAGKEIPRVRERVRFGIARLRGKNRIDEYVDIN